MRRAVHGRGRAHRGRLLRHHARIHPPHTRAGRPQKARPNGIRALRRRVLRHPRGEDRRRARHRRAHQPHGQEGDEARTHRERPGVRGHAGARTDGSGRGHTGRQRGTARRGREGHARTAGQARSARDRPALADRQHRPRGGGARAARLPRQSDSQFGERRRAQSARNAAPRQEIRRGGGRAHGGLARRARDRGGAAQDRRAHHTRSGQAGHSPHGHIRGLPDAHGGRGTGAGGQHAGRHTRGQEEIRRQDGAGREQHILRPALPQGDKHRVFVRRAVGGAGPSPYSTPTSPRTCRR